MISRTNKLSSNAAKMIKKIIFCVFVISYLCATVVIFFALFPHTRDALYALVSQPQSIITSEIDVPAHQALQGKMAAEQNRAERQLMIAKNMEQGIKAVQERRDIFDQEQSYVLPEGISGTEDRYIPSRNSAIDQSSATNETLPSETKILVQEMVASSEVISTILNEQNTQEVPPSPAQQTFPLQQQQTAPIIQKTASVINSEKENNPATQQQIIPQQFIEKTAPQISLSMPLKTEQVQGAAQQVSCEKIKMYMDGEDLQILHRAMKQETGVAMPWKGPSGSYVVTPASVKGNCREYSIQANIQGTSLQCSATCANIAPSVPQQRNDKSVIIDSMTSTDQDALIKALNYHGPVSWRSLNGIFYTVSPVRLGNPCREYTVQANIQGRIFQYLESNCQ